jgi:hypothetical protein
MKEKNGWDKHSKKHGSFKMTSILLINTFKNLIHFIFFMLRQCFVSWWIHLHFLLEFNLSEYTISLPMVEDNTRKRRNLRSFTKTKRRQNKHPSIPKNPFPKAIYSTIRFSLTTTKKKLYLTTTITVIKNPNHS